MSLDLIKSAIDKRIPSSQFLLDLGDHLIALKQINSLNDITSDPLLAEYLVAYSTTSRQTKPSDLIHSLFVSTNYSLLSNVFITLAFALTPTLVSDPNPYIKAVTPILGACPDQIRESLASFLIALSRLSHINTMDAENAQSFSSSLSAYMSALSESHPPLAHALTQAYSQLLAGSNPKAPLSLSCVSNRRTGFLSLRVSRLLWLSSLMCSLPEVHSPTFENALKNKLPDSSPQLTASILVESAFDALASSILSKDSAARISLWKLFLCHRLPHVLKSVLSPLSNTAALISSIVQSMDKYVISICNSQDTPVSSFDGELEDMFSAFPSTNSDIRIEFIISCISIGLLETVPAFPGVTDSQIAEVEPLISLFDSSMSDINSIMDNAPNADLEEALCSLNAYALPNQSLITQGISYGIESYIAKNDYARLHWICQLLAANPVLLDIWTLNQPASKYIAMIINFLDNWPENDQDDLLYQEKYTYFGSILLFIATIRRRYNVNFRALNISENSYVINVISSSGNSVDLNTADTLFSERIGKWIVALFGTEGIGDELLGSISVKEFIKMVPYIFDQIILAATLNAIDLETIKGGLEYFMQPFLLPYLYFALTWVNSELWRLSSIQDSAPLGHICGVLVMQNPTEGQSIHRAVLNATASTLMETLDVLDAQGISVTSSHSPSSGLFLAFKQVLSPIADLSITCPTVNIQHATASNVLAQVRSLTSWGANTTSIVNILSQGKLDEEKPPDKMEVDEQNGVKVQSSPSQSADHHVAFAPLLLSEAVFLMGAETVLQLLVDEYRAVDQQNVGHSALDAIVSLIRYAVPLPESNEKDLKSYLTLFNPQTVSCKTAEPSMISANSAGWMSCQEAIDIIKRRVEEV
ncbi:hypothetical protein CANCADRAFT_3743 [Tortispora caseinolytica NRRL Y-17796]|uniref:Mediator of RNA polymerase II transcription subunit 5 n=1 Tax=Tortispora caseinolytica NRRL Y-17796 TaxID=767744 RepID=A0A1E4TBI0_9ASCO|nr:hypothetical protein CANCADRAFT_3743 [Tortispora caseinolytica NRRL Y-17796]